MVEKHFLTASQLEALANGIAVHITRPGEESLKIDPPEASKYHVVCHDCTFESVEDRRDVASHKRAKHAFETDADGEKHNVEYAEVA